MGRRPRLPVWAILPIGLLVIVLLVAVIAHFVSFNGSSSYGPVSSPAESQPETTAGALCARALGSGVLSATSATVQDVRTTTTHGGAQPFKAAFPGLGDSDPAAFCWTGGGGTYHAYGVASVGRPVLLSTVEGPGGSWSPSGPPVFP